MAFAQTLNCLVPGPRGIGPGTQRRRFVCEAYVAKDARGNEIVLTPEDGVVLAPWVNITFVAPFNENSDLGEITVGNRSSPDMMPKNAAVIKSFEFGYSDGMSVRVTIQDQQGGSFVQFMQNCVKHFSCLNSASLVEMKFTFGWTKSNCDVPFGPSRSPCYFAILDSIETNFSDSKFTFEITGKDKGFRMFEGGSGKVYTEKPLRTAIEELFKEKPDPTVDKVSFKTYQTTSGNVQSRDGVIQPVDAKFKDGDPVKGPTDTWLCNSRDKIQTAMEWLKQHPSSNGLGWKPTYNFQESGGEIIFWEDRSPQCKAQADDFWDRNSIGTYIVNGSKYSPVLEFSPKIRWDFSRLTGVGGGQTSVDVRGPGPGAKDPGDNCNTLNRENNKGAGQNASVIPTNAKINATSNATAAKEAAKAQAAATKAMKLITDPISADLTVVGDPTLVPPSQGMYQKNCAIIVINPYFIGDEPSVGRCGEWLATPICNEVLSNKAWQIASITHRIEIGKFTTTLNVFLAVPGEDIDVGEGLGAWQGGWKPNGKCGG